jgi:hypothetical protein
MFRPPSITPIRCLRYCTGSLPSVIASTVVIACLLLLPHFVKQIYIAFRRKSAAFPASWPAKGKLFNHVFFSLGHGKEENPLTESQAKARQSWAKNPGESRQGWFQGGNAQDCRSSGLSLSSESAGRGSCRAGYKRYKPDKGP